MKLKFEDVYKQSYKLFLNEEAPIPSVLNQNSPEDTADVKNIPSLATQENPEKMDTESNLPDPRDVIGVKTDILKMFKDFFNSDPQRQNEFKRYLSGRSIDSDNVESIIGKMKEFISVGETPKEISI
jgi:hypothetical protein